MKSVTRTDLINSILLIVFGLVLVVMVIALVAIPKATAVKVSSVEDLTFDNATCHEVSWWRQRGVIADPVIEIRCEDWSYK